jgi:hypothetical protein
MVFHKKNSFVLTTFCQKINFCCICVCFQEALKLTADLRKRKQDLLHKQLAQQKLLIERLENSGVAPEQREALMETIKKLQVSFMMCFIWVLLYS